MNYPDGAMTKQTKRIPNSGDQCAIMNAPQLNPTFVARTQLLGGSISGLRNIDSLGSILRVSAGPFSELDRMKAMICSSYVAYVVETTPIYPGYGRKTRDIGVRVARQLQPTTQVYLIYWNDDRFASAAVWPRRPCDFPGSRPTGRARANSSFGRSIERFEGAQQTQTDSPTRTLATGNLHDVQVLDPEAMTIPTDGLRMRLDRQDIRVEGFTVDNRFHLLPGADYSYADKPGLSEENSERRRAIEAMDILEPVPGIPGRARLRVGLDCKSRAMAGKILSGASIGSKAWKEQPDLHIGAPS
jgi:hypothetical protein